MLAANIGLESRYDFAIFMTEVQFFRLRYIIGRVMCAGQPV